MIFVLLMALAADADEPAVVEVDKVALAQQKQADEAQLTSEIRDLVVSICGGRCELLAVDAEVREKNEVRDRLPGFEKMAKVDKHYVIDKATVRIAADNKLSASSKSGLVRAIKGKLQDAAPTVDVQIQPFDWPTPRGDAPTPIVLTTQQNDKPAAAIAPPPPVVPPPTPKEKLLLAFAAAAPKLLALVLVMGFLSLLASQLFALWRKKEPVVAEAERAADVVVTEAAAVASPLLDECKQNNTLKVALVRRALREQSPETVAKYLQALAIERVPELHDGPLGAKLADAYRALRQLAGHAGADTVAELERLWLQVAAETTPDARFLPLQQLDARAFQLLCAMLSKDDRAPLLLLSPADLRERYFATLEAGERQALIASALEAAAGLREPLLSVLAQKLESALAGVHTSVQVQDRAIAWLQSELAHLDADAQGAFLQRLQRDEAWQPLIERAVVTEDDLVALSDTALANFIVSIAPQTLCTFTVAASAGARARIEPLLPRYLRPMYDEEKTRSASGAQIAEARRALFAALLLVERAPAKDLKLVALK